MVNNNQFLYEIKKPVIQEVRHLEDYNNKIPTIEEIKQQGLSPEFKAALLNPNSRFSADTKVYCAFVDCPHQTPFNLNIDIEGCKWWMRENGYGDDLPGYWKESWTSDRYKKESLCLKHIGHAQEADKLLDWERLYTVGTTGIKAVEWREFNSATKSLIEECMEAHQEYGAAINISKTIPSGTTGFTKWGIKIAAGVVATPILGPGGAVIAGAATWGASEAGKALCDNKAVNSVLNITSVVGKDMAKGPLINATLGSAGDLVVGGMMTGSSEVGRLAGTEVMNLADKFGYVKNGFEFVDHLFHFKKGIDYDPHCKVCTGD